MFRRKSSVLAAVVAMLASSIVGGTVLRSPDATATDVDGGATDVIDQAREQLETIEDVTIELTEQPVVDAAGEKLILVVAGRAPSLGDGQALLEDVNAKFGRLQGLYLDEARHYDVTGMLVQTSPEAVAVECTTAEDGHSTLDCPDGVRSVSELQTVQLEFVEKSAFPSFSLPSCGGVGLAPCHERYLELLKADLGFEPTDWLALTAFRTKRGAEEFVELARAVGITGLVVVQATKLGGGDVGLGQEPHPDGSGPLLEPLPDQEAYQR
jgi:hypothetical protein